MFYEQLIKLCSKNNITPYFLMRQLGVNTDCLRRWEKGGAVSSEVLVQLSDFFGVTVDYLLFGNRSDSSLTLDKYEREAVLKFRLLQPEDRGRILERMEVMYEEYRAKDRNTQTHLASGKATDIEYYD